MRYFKLFALGSFLFINTVGFSAQAQNSSPPAYIDAEGFQKITQKAFEQRDKQRIDLKTFIQMAQEAHTVILDTRSANAYQRKHIEGALHLNFSDFTQAKLEKLIPDKGTRSLIYCNNNFSDDPQNFPTKSAPLALNIPTFINLYGYGYTHIYELKDLLSVENPALRFVGTEV